MKLLFIGDIGFHTREGLLEVFFTRFGIFILMFTSPLGYTCSKHFAEYPCCHRQWRHPGHCRFVHGYSRSFTFWFASLNLDEFGFVVDFSGLKPLEHKLRNHFDHTFLVNADDPLLEEWKELDEKGALDLRVMENVGMEATAKLVWEWANDFLWEKELGRTCCWKVKASENDLNAACFQKTPDWFSNDKNKKM